jgi:hypothetical protein
MFDEIHHADWSTGTRKRWVASAHRTDAGWAAFGPRRVGPSQAFLDELAGAALTRSLVPRANARNRPSTLRRPIDVIGTGRTDSLLGSTLRGRKRKLSCATLSGGSANACFLIQNINSAPEGDDGEEIRKIKRARGTGTISSLQVYCVLGNPVGCHER